LNSLFENTDYKINDSKSKWNNCVTELFFTVISSQKRDSLSILSLFVVVVIMRPTGNLQIGSGGIEAKEMKVKVSLNTPVATIIQHIRKYLKLPPSDSLYVYLNEAFLPAPNDYLFDLYNSHKVDNKLIFAYSCTPVWG